MKQGLLILLSVCVFASAFVPRYRRALDRDREEPAPSTTQGPKHICAHTTPCAWYVYSPISKVIETNLTNNYCKCGKGFSCEYYEDDSIGTSYVYRCREISTEAVTVS